MHCRRHEMNGRVVFALCDKELIGKIIKDEKRIINLKDYAEFYIGNDADLLGDHFESINAVGKKSVNFLLKKGIIKRKNIVRVGGIPHVQVYKI